MGILGSNRVKFSVIAVVAVLILGIIGSAVAVATWTGGYSESSSVEDLQSARGVIYDHLTTTDGRNWVTSGEWTLKCRRACAEAKLHQIEFDIAHAMYLDPAPGDPGAKGDNSHGHQWSNFSATSAAMVAAGKLEIKGNISGSGPIKDVRAIITLVKSASGHFTFFFEVEDGVPAADNPKIIETVMGGAVIESKGGRSDDDDDDD